MKEYKVEIVRFIQTAFDSNKAIVEAKAEEQTKLDEYDSTGSNRRIYPRALDKT